MDASRHQRISEIFDAARNLPPDQRHAYLQRACGNDAGMLAEVRSLLEHHERTGQALEQPLVQTPPSAVGPGAAASVSERAIPTSIGRYQIIRKIGEGGMGTVFEAQQENPRRTVALKVIHAGISSSGMLRRFEHEAQILGRLQHPGIAQIFEAGTFEPGGPGSRPQPFFAMELIGGVPLNEYAAAHDLDARQRLGLIAAIGDAVQHAHQKGVIHRDLKPGNILVNAAGQPKILDFGVARVTDSDVQLTTLQTDVGQLIGTLPYMSPEQAAGDADAIDTRSDVYALGVLAYELLSGRLPYDLQRCLMHEAVRVIRDEEPTRLSGINRTFRGDIETIVGKALEKDRTRRYQSASDLSEDIRRYLRDETVIARPPSRLYQFRKFAKRNKAVVAGVAAVFLALLAGVIGTSSALVRAVDAEHVATHRLGLITDEKARVEREKAKVEAVNRFQLEMLQSVDPRVAASNRDVTMRETLDEAAKKVDEGSLKDQPEIEAAVRYTLGSTYYALGAFPEAIRHLKISLDLRLKALGPEHLDIAETKSMLGETYRESGDVQSAEPLLREALALRQKISPGDSTQMADYLNNVALIEKAKRNLDACEDLNRQALDMRRRVHIGDHADIMMSLNNLAMVLMTKRGDPKEIDALFQEGVDLGRRLYKGDHLFTANLLQNQAELREAVGDIPGAVAAMTEACDMRIAVLGEEHAWAAESMNNLAAILKRKGDFTAAEPLYRKSLEVRRKIFGDDGEVTGQSYNNLANLLQSTGRAEEAEPLSRKALEIARKHRPADDGLTATYMTNLATILQSESKLPEAEEMARGSIEMRQRLGQNSGPNYAIALANLAAVVRDLSADRLDEVESLQRQALELMRNNQPPSPPQIAHALNNLGITLRDQGGDKLDEAEAMEREALDIRRKALGDDSPLTALTMHNLGSVLFEKRQFDEAERHLRTALEVRRAKLAPGTVEIASTLTLLGSVYVELARFDEAEAALREGLEMRVKALPAGHLRIAESEYALGDILMKMNRPLEAEPLLVDACTILAATRTSLRPRMRQAFDVLIERYESTGRADKAAQWRQRRDAAMAPPATNPTPATAPATQP